MAPPVAVQQLQLINVNLNHYPNNIINKWLSVDLKYTTIYLIYLQ